MNNYRAPSQGRTFLAAPEATIPANNYYKTPGFSQQIQSASSTTGDFETMSQA
jgi:hypothetical protein